MNQAPRSSDWPPGPGGMAGRLRAHDWAATPLGPPAAWPERLRAAAELMLANPLVSSLACGPERALLYNDAAARLYGGRHPGVLGLPLAQAFPGSYPGVAALYDRAFAGEAVSVAARPVDVSEAGGEAFDATLVPVRGRAGEVIAVLMAGVEAGARAKAEAALRESEARFRNMADHAPVMMWTTDATGRCTYLNRRWYEFTGQTREEALGLGWLGATHPEDRDAAERVFLEANARAAPFRLDYRLRRADGAHRWAIDAAAPRLGEDGAFLGYVGSVIDIDERREAELRLTESEERHRAIVETATDYAILTTDPEGRVVTWTAGAAGVLGWTAEEAVGRMADMTYTPEDRAAGVPERERREARERGQAPDVRWHLRRDGSRVFIDGVVRPLAGRDGASPGFVKVGQDVTERRREQARRDALVRLADRLRDLGDAGEIAFAASEVLGEALGVSRVGYASIDHEAETLHVERDWTAPGVGTLAGTLRLRDYGSFIDTLKRGEQVAIPDVRLDERTAAAAAALEGRSARSFMNVPVTERGRLVAVLFINEARVRDWPPEDLALIGEVASRTRTAVERSRAASALRELNETLERRVAERTSELALRTSERDRLWTLSEDLLARADYQGMMSAVSPAWTRVLGWSEAELLARPYATLLHPEDAEVTLAAVGRMGGTGLPTRFENRIATADGGWKPIEWTVAPEPDAPNFIAVGRDLSEAKAREAELAAAQEQLRQSQKMEAMGSLTGGVAHDFNNLLTPIIGSLDRLVTRGVGSERERRLLAGALESAERAKTLVQRLLAFARRQPLQAVAVDVGALVRGMADLIGSTLGPAIDVRVEVEEGLPPAKADPNQLEMALLNLAVNARDAMPGGGRLTVGASRESVRSRSGRGQHRIPPGLRPGHYVRLSVADTGTGMDPATLARAVEPFFSTKGIGRGTGLGLSMVHGLAAQLGGGLAIDSAPGQGTTVALWLSVSAEPAEEADAERASAAAPGASRGRALLVDDEPLVRMSTADMLVDLGFEVLEAGTAEEAVALLRGGQAVDLLVTDHLMPGMSGADLAREARLIQPGLPVLIVSGYAEADGIAPGLPRLVKPFRASELAERVGALTTT